jgi:hypothetical protein
MLLLGIIASQGRVASTAYESIATVSVGGGGSASISFTSIPSTFKHLQIRAIARSNFSSGTAGDFLGVRLNSDTGNNYANHNLYGDGSTVAAFATTSQPEMYGQRVSGSDSASSIFGTFVIDLLDYANTNKNSVIRNLGGFDSNGFGRIYFNSGLWLNTAAVTSITIFPGSGSSIDQYSSFALYGIKGA